MSYFTMSEARASAASIVQKSYSSKPSARILREAIDSANDWDTFDVFLSHSIKDADLILGVKGILERQNLKVYVDWHDDPQASRTHVTKQTAALLRKRMRQSKSLVYAATENASTSKWMPWELGYFDGFRPKSVAILPLVERTTSSFQGQEYLGLYPLIQKGTYTTGQSDVFVEERGSEWATLRQFGKGSAVWAAYS